MTQSQVSLRVHESHTQLTPALANARAFKTKILPRAETLLKAAESRYEAGDTSLADVLPIRRDWATIRLSHLESVRDVMQAWAEMSSFVPIE